MWPFHSKPSSRLAGDMSPEDWKRIGRLEAEVETLRLQWANYRDELKRLVNRLEKRDQRAEAAAKPVGSPVAVDLVSERVRARREHGKQAQANGGP